MGIVFYVVSAVLAVSGLIVWAVFGRDTPEEARTRIAHVVRTASSWPVRFFTYRSGRGKHREGRIYEVCASCKGIVLHAP